MDARLIAGTVAATVIGAGAGALLKGASGSDSMRNPVVSIPVFVGGLTLAHRGGAVAASLIAPKAGNALRIGSVAGLAAMGVSMGALMLRDVLHHDAPPRIEDAPLAGAADDPTRLDGAVLGTLHLARDSGGGTAVARVVEDLPGSFPTRMAAERHIMTTADPDATWAVVGSEPPGSDRASWHVARVEVTRADGTTVPMRHDALYDAFVHPVDGRGYDAATWADTAGDSLALAGFYGRNTGFWVPLTDEPNMQPHREHLPAGM